MVNGVTRQAYLVRLDSWGLAAHSTAGSWRNKAKGWNVRKHRNGCEHVGILKLQTAGFRLTGEHVNYWNFAQAPQRFAFYFSAAALYVNASGYISIQKFRRLDACMIRVF